MIRHAAADEDAAVMAVLDEGRAAIAELGIGQWQHGYPNLEAVRVDIEAGDCWVAADARTGTLLGTCAICLGRDVDYTAATAAGMCWLTDDASDPVPYAAVHRCAVACAAARRGVMGALLARAERIAREAGRASLRMDTHPGNVRMRAFLAKRGFTELGPFDMVGHAVAGDTVRIAYEKLL